MRERHELNRAWRGAPWGRRLADDWAGTAVPELPTSHPWRALALTVLLGVALGVVIAQGLAQQDRSRLDSLMRQIDPSG